MKIHRLSVQNFRSFKEKTELNDIKPVSVFVGANNAGKSNVFEILSFLRAMANGSRLKQHIECTFDRTTDPFLIEIELELSESERSSGKKVADILQKYLHEKTQPDLDKPELAQQLAYDIVDEIKSGMSRSETEFEKEVKRILEIINSISMKVN